MSNFVTSCRFNAVSGGVGSFVVASAVAGHVTPNNASAADKVYHYYAQTPDGLQSEEGHGVYSVATQTLLRTTIDQNSVGTFVPINFVVAPEVDIFPSVLPLEIPLQKIDDMVINGGMDVSVARKPRHLRILGNPPQET